MRTSWLVLVLGGLVSAALCLGCESDKGSPGADVCKKVCACAGNGDSDACVSDCSGAVSGYSAACLECAEAQSCEVLLAVTQGNSGPVEAACPACRSGGGPGADAESYGGGD